MKFTRMVRELAFLKVYSWIWSGVSKHLTHHTQGVFLLSHLEQGLGQLTLVNLRTLVLKTHPEVADIQFVTQDELEQMKSFLDEIKESEEKHVVH